MLHWFRIHSVGTTLDPLIPTAGNSMKRNTASSTTHPCSMLCNSQTTQAPDKFKHILKTLIWKKGIHELHFVGIKINEYVRRTYPLCILTQLMLLIPSNGKESNVILNFAPLYL